MLNNILMASDFSKHAHYALQRATTLARQNKASLHFVHILNNSWMANFTQFPINEMQQALFAEKKKAEQQLFNLLKEYTHDSSSHVSVLTGRVIDEIVRYAEENHCELIVAGAHGQYYINDYLLGTTSESIVRQSHIPALLIKKEPMADYKRILITTDFSEVSKGAVEFAFNCFPQATLQVLHVLDIHHRQFFDKNEDVLSSKPPITKDIIERLDDFLKTCHVGQKKFQKKIIGGYFADAIVEQSEQWQADLIVFGTQGNSKLHYMIMGSVATRILHKSGVDMLVVPPKKNN
ncbi:Universal stress protein A [Legionella longbeachae]|uniref:Universal stress protein family protein n=2 Tax=Legionella oakridgensis TaxID=29423 RepID=A0A0W0WY25_9GAMM|nr:universal stress protein UspA [Legionella oakridgensis RV-2-2007]KTD37227.1 universal stress protein family protein [Legionella oakridgensis]STY16179.1 Universal stress protein A [Legionella longbeachae]